MESFKDKNGKAWSIELNVGSARNVKGLTGVDLLNTIVINNNGSDTTVLDQLCEDVYMLMNVIAILCKTQMREANISEDEFFENIDACAIEGAVDALVKEIINFSPPSKRKVLNLIYAKIKSFRAKEEQHLETLINDKTFQDELDIQLSRQFTSSQE